MDAVSNDSAKAGQMIKCSRDVAVMVFLWKNRTEAVGRLLRVLFYKHRTDHKGAAYLFELNHHESLVAFHVPRDYKITALAAEREKCRENKEFSRAHVIRDQCLMAGYRFNVGGKLVKVSSAADEQCEDGNTVIFSSGCGLFITS